MNNTDPKRKLKEEDEEEEESEDEWIGPRPDEAAVTPKPKKIKGKLLKHEQMYLDYLPCAEYYEKSYMHRDTVMHVVVTKTDFIITGSSDGHIKFWKKQEEGVEFVKHFRAHLGNVQHLAANTAGTRLVSISHDKSLKVFDVENFDMINMMKLNFTPSTSEWIHPLSDPQHSLAVSDSTSPKIYIFDGHGTNTPLHILSSIHTKPVTIIKYNVSYDIVISVDEIGMIEYWCGTKNEFQTPNCVNFKSKLDTDLFEFVKHKTVPRCMAISPNGLQFATIGADKKVRVFKFLTGKLTRVFDESLQHYTELQQRKQQIPNMEFGRRLAVERDVEKGGALAVCNLVYDESGYFLLYATMLGVKIVNLYNNRLVRTIGKPENLRLLNLALFQGAITMEMEASENPALDSARADPTLVATAFRKNRFYLFTRRDATDTKSVDTDRDVFNEKPSKEDIIAATEQGGGQRLYETAVLHTSLGDITLKLFPKECPKTVENFCVHAKNGFYNGHLFHRIIKQFMIQTGDPLALRHDRPYTLSMANAGPNTNGSQFFITVIPTPWLDTKHTVFGRVIRGMEVVQNISNVKCNPKTDKPYDDITIISVTVK
ncbi:Peptidylprolyl isomerase domain and WD repeat-containing protein 1-like [Homarus americanus]|uniref:peptidylprolyl isomerase n=1 Tax=Homarus americanus TaxID=6706 RepID=A0A8J5JZY9_HOMAM|nr:Peptidylprolyl isomerase domain and WD repeat-containing protein 1-like [Homarus americanus]